MTAPTIRLGGRGFEIQPLTLGQLRVLLDVVGDLTGKSGGELVEAAARIIVAGLARSEPDITLETVMSMEADLDELNGAVAAILKAAGLAPKEPQTGEAAPVATAETSSPAFTEPSPPAADTRFP
jgi:hypothetical protein